MSKMFKKPSGPGPTTPMVDTTGMAPHKDHFHDEAGSKHYGAPGLGKDIGDDDHVPDHAPTEKEVAVESRETQKAAFKRKKRGSNSITTSLQRRGGSGLGTTGKLG